MTATIADRQVTLGRSVITYREAGAGPALVLLHGIGSAARAFDDQLAGLSKSLRVIAWEAPGYAGSTALPMEAPVAADYAAALASFLNALDIKVCHLVGHSLGALMAASFAADRPQRLLSLTLASIAGGHAKLPAADRDKQLAQRIGDVAEFGPRAMAEKRGPRLLGPEATPVMIRRVVDTMAAIRPDGYAQAARMLASGDVKVDIARLPAGMPVQILYGDADVITPPARNVEIAAVRPQAPVHAIAGGGHAVYLEKPETFNDLLSRFIASVK